MPQTNSNCLAPGQLININIPDLTPGPPKGIRVVPQATRMIRDKFVRHTAPDGRDYYWFTCSDFDFRAADTPIDNDLDAVDDRYIAITPLQFDLTRYDLLRELQGMRWDTEREAGNQEERSSRGEVRS